MGARRTSHGSVRKSKRNAPSAVQQASRRCPLEAAIRSGRQRFFPRSAWCSPVVQLAEPPENPDLPALTTCSSLAALRPRKRDTGTGIRFCHLGSLRPGSRVAVSSHTARRSSNEAARLRDRAQLWTADGVFWLQELLGSYYGGVPAVLVEFHWGTSCSRVTHPPRHRFARRVLTAPSVRTRQSARLRPARNL